MSNYINKENTIPEGFYLNLFMELTLIKHKLVGELYVFFIPKADRVREPVSECDLTKIFTSRWKPNYSFEEFRDKIDSYGIRREKLETNLYSDELYQGVLMISVGDLCEFITKNTDK